MHTFYYECESYIVSFQYVRSCALIACNRTLTELFFCFFSLSFKFMCKCVLCVCVWCEWHIRSIKMYVSLCYVVLIVRNLRFTPWKCTKLKNNRYNCLMIRKYIVYYIYRIYTVFDWIQIWMQIYLVYICCMSLTVMAYVQRTNGKSRARDWSGSRGVIVWFL